MRCSILVCVALFVQALMIESGVGQSTSAFTSKQLEINFEFPSSELEKDEVYLFRAESFSVDKNGYIYIVNKGLNQILKFDSRGNFISRIGRKGEGPGEFQGPNKVIPYDDTILVYDNWNRNVQTFNSDGTYKNSFRTAIGYWDMVINSKGQIFAIPIHRRKTDSPDLLEVYSVFGEMFGSFGTPIKYKGQAMRSIDRYILETNDKDEIIFVSRFWPVVRIYSHNLELIKEHELNHPVLVEKAKYNREQEKLNHELSMEHPRKYVINDIVYRDSRYYIFYTTPHLGILEYDDHWHLLSEYSFESEEIYTSFCFIVREEAGEKLFYVLEIVPDNRVIVFTEKKLVR